MPSVEENRSYWGNYQWSNKGDEWSVGYGGTEPLWAWAIMPRVAAFLPAEHILEIAPGHGRITQFLAPASQRMSVVDLTESCIVACQERFKEYDHIDYHINDGKSLDMIDDESIDFVFSWDSLIHVEADVMESYLTQLGRKLRPGGVGLLHHSNLAEYSDPATGELTIDNEHWRAASMSAAKFRQFCQSAGLRCLVQELVPWGGANFTDCISLFRRETRRAWPFSTRTGTQRTKILRDSHFFEQVQGKQAGAIRDTARLYRAAD
jgi:2-polyprenyl-3-methyl-5-hydroxy-6-metoxy-1,4-benzoquinol methylase